MVSGDCLAMLDRIQQTIDDAGWREDNDGREWLDRGVVLGALTAEATRPTTDHKHNWEAAWMCACGVRQTVALFAADLVPDGVEERERIRARLYDHVRDGVLLIDERTLHAILHPDDQQADRG